MAKAKPRQPQRLYRRLGEVVETVRGEYRGSEIYRRYFGGPHGKAGGPTG